METDENTTIQQLKEHLRAFRDERDWKQFHDPKNLAEAISIEAAELLELFLWKSLAEVKKLVKSDRDFRTSLEEELADVFCFGLSLATAAKIDVASAMRRKVGANRLKYPIEKAKGKATKYNRL